ncbi:DUF308 domain-containing protein [Muricauda sp. 334s03]|uniref:DUF308 domain-containing protein n=2 Tax=Flagellimonas TaxID=444459 RepID=A0ABT5XNJ0_9FLAO|nr:MULTISPECIES: DUF308 domain-containing protein [Allomuricauda]MDF0707461.1 DUF308 domain-containing protein [[Muricauda] okinawensis]MDF0715362.1 DUF308 domain-containing protein [[Muricauda] yonaguniensis]
MENLKSALKEIRTDIKNWWALLILGLVFIVLGVTVFAYPLESYVSLSVLFAVSAIVSGLLQIWFATTNRNEIDGWGWQLALGIMELILGVILISNFGLTLVILPFYVGFWLLFRAFTLIGFSFELKTYKILDWGYYLIFGLLLVPLSWFIILNPLFGGVTIVAWTAIAFIVTGVANIILSFKLKKVNKKIVQVEKSIK